MSERQKITGQSSTIELLTISYGATPTLLRFSNSSRDVGTSITWDSVSYLIRDFSMSGLTVVDGGPAPRPSLEIDNVDRLFYPLIENNSDLRGSDVTYTQVFRSNLDHGSSPDTSSPIAQCRFKIFSLEGLSRNTVQFTLASQLDKEYALFGRQALPNVCPRSYRTPADTADTFIAGSCPYNQTGSGAYFKEDGTPTTDYTEDKCPRTLVGGCEVRFGSGALQERSDGALPFQGFPGVGLRS